MRELYVSETTKELAVVEDGKLCECVRNTPVEAQSILLGRVERIVPGMKAAFVDIGQKRNGFLPLSEHSMTLPTTPMQTGDRVLVQIKKEAVGEKGAFLTRDIALCGEYALFMPFSTFVGVSSRITDAARRNELKEIGQALCGGQFGLVLRNRAQEIPVSVVEEEVSILRQQWEEIRQRAATAHAPSILFQAETPLEALVRDYGAASFTHVVTNGVASALTAYGFSAVQEEAGDLLERHGLRRQVDKALQRKVWLDCGGTLVIDRCEAMTVIDVNSAKFTGKRDIQQTILQVNLEACREIARQVRLRNLSGIILIDFIDMETEDHRQQVLSALAQAFAPDRVKTVLHGFTSLGLVEMTRKRSRTTLYEDYTMPCPSCGGTGRKTNREETNP